MGKKGQEGRPEGFGTTTAGNLPESMVIHIDEPYFARDANYNKGQTAVLFWKGTVEDVVDANGEEIEDYDVNERPPMFPCGEGWDTFDDGETVEHSQGKTEFTDRSAVGILLDRCFDVLGIGDELAARGDSALQAKIWKGLTFQLEREEFDYGINKQTGQPMKTSRLMPVKLLEAGKAGKGKKAAAKEAPAKAKASKAKAAEPDEDEDEKGSGGGILDNLDKKMLLKLKKAVKEADGDSEVFASLAMDIDGVEDDDDLVSAIADDSLWEALNV